MPRRPRYRSLDHWRGVACLMIVVLHAIQRTKGTAEDPIARLLLHATGQLGLGVPFFFVISGYCIAATCDASRRRDHAPLEFFKRRFRRIFPPYWAAAVICLAVVVVATAAGQADLVSGDYSSVPHPRDLTLAQWFGNFTLTETWRSHVFGGPELKIVGPAWTLCYEEQFYAVCGGLLYLAPRHFFRGVALVTLATLALIPVARLYPDAFYRFFFDGHWLMFAEGVAVYWIRNYGRRPRAAVVAFVLLFGLCFFVRTRSSVAADPDARREAWERLGSTGFALLLLVVQRFDDAITKARWLRPIGFLGQTCYSLYLIHWPVTMLVTGAFYRGGVQSFWGTMLVTAPIATGLSLLAGWAFHRTVEQRFLNVAPAPMIEARS